MTACRGILSVLFFLLVVSVFATKGEAATPADMTPIGVAKVDITPDTPVRMYGYASRKTESEGIAGRLSATALAIGENGGRGPAVLLAVDCGAVPQDLRNEVYKRVTANCPVAPERFVLCNSHCHSGPNLKGMASLDGEEREHLEQYAKKLTDQLVQVCQQALGNRKPAGLELARGSVAVAANRRVITDGKWSGFGAVPGAPVDHELALLRVTSADGQILALVANYACHNTTLRGNFMEIHGDWAGSAQKFIETDQAGIKALITIGCGADSDPCPHGTVELCDQHGRAVADEVKRLLADGEWTSIAPRIDAKHKVIEVPWLKNPDMEVARETAKKSWAVERVLDQLEKGEELSEPQTFQITTWTLGDDLAMVFMSDELVADYVLRLKQEFDAKRLWVSAYSNDVSRYVVSPRIIEEGGYEARNSLSSLVTFGQPERLDPPMIERIVGTIRSMLPKAFLPQ